MIRSDRRVLLACLLGLSVAQISVAKTAIPKSYVDEKTRDIAGGRKVLIIIGQDKLLPGIDSYELGAADAMNAIEKSIDKGLIARGQKEIVPITDALAGYDFDTPMKEALTAAAHSADWIRAQDIEFTRDGSDAAIEKALNASDTRQMLVLRATYQTDWRYTAILVSVESSLLVRQIPKGQRSNARLKADYIPYRQTFRSMVFLPGTDGKKRDENIPRWAAEGASLARRALDIGLKQLPPLLVRNLNDDAKSAAAWLKRNKRMTVTRAQMLGWVVGPSDEGTLFVEARTGTLVRMQTLTP